MAPVGGMKEQKVDSVLMYNEFIVYDTAQSRPRLLCEFKFKHK